MLYVIFLIKKVCTTFQFEFQSFQIIYFTLGNLDSNPCSHGYLQTGSPPGFTLISKAIWLCRHWGSITQFLAWPVYFLTICQDCEGHWIVTIFALLWHVIWLFCIWYQGSLVLLMTIHQHLPTIPVSNFSTIFSYSQSVASIYHEKSIFFPNYWAFVFQVLHCSYSLQFP